MAAAGVLEDVLSLAPPSHILGHVPFQFRINKELDVYQRDGAVKDRDPNGAPLLSAVSALRSALPHPHWARMKPGFPLSRGKAENLCNQIRFPVSFAKPRSETVGGRTWKLDDSVLTPTINKEAGYIVPQEEIEARARITHQLYRGSCGDLLAQKLTALSHRVLEYEPETVKWLLTAVLLPKFRENEEDDARTWAQLQRHVAASGALVLRGPPHANEHVVDPHRAHEWAMSFCTTEQRQYADHIWPLIRYIPQAELLVALGHCIDLVVASMDRGVPVGLVLDSGYMSKSNYYIAVMFVALWRSRDIHPPISFTTSSLVVPFPATLIEVDDMMYTGSQSVSTSREVSAALDVEAFEPVLCALAPELRTERGTMDMIFPPLREYFMSALRSRLYLVRAFMSSQAVTTWYHECRRFVPHVLVSHAVIDGFKDTFKVANSGDVARAIESDKAAEAETVSGAAKASSAPTASSAAKPRTFDPARSDAFDEDVKFEELDKVGFEATFRAPLPAALVYFDHKVADFVSTFLTGIGLGAVPVPPRGLLMQPGNLRPGSRAPCVPQFHRFIKFCPAQLPGDMDTTGAGDEKGKSDVIEDADVRRCPLAWYKYIDYDRGVYSPPW